MLKKLYEAIQESTKPEVMEIDGHTYQISPGTRIPMEIRPELDEPETLPLNSLDALVKMVRTEAAVAETAPLYITIPDPLTVKCFSQFQEEHHNKRRLYYMVDATDVPGWDGGEMSFEKMQIALFTRFQDSSDSNYVQMLLSNITTGAKVTFNDNGVATTVVTQKGVAMQDQTRIKNVVCMKPYRTFQEVDQPESPFLIRISEHGIRLIEADGGMWKLTARQTIKDYLEEALKEEVESGSVYVAL